MLLVVLFACGGPPPSDTGGGDTASGGGGVDSPEVVPGLVDVCPLASDLADPNFLEGDVVSFTVSCAGEDGADDVVFAAAGLPPGATFDPETRRFTWATGPADGGRIDAAFRLTAPDGTTGIGTVPFWVADDPSRADNVPVVPVDYREEWGLPVMHVSTTAEPSGTYADATITWGGVVYPASLKVHGRTSTHYPKNSYTLRFDATELPIEEWGVTRERVLLVTTFDDNSYVRQKLMFDVWAAMAEAVGQPRLTPRATFVVVYRDGAYLGLYGLEDFVDDEFLGQMGFDRDADLYKAVGSDANFYLTGVDGEPKDTPHDGYDKKEGDDLADYAAVDALVEFTGGSDTATLLAGLGDRVDVDEFMDWFLLVHYANAEDSADKNSYLYETPDSGVFRFVPWDFNASWGQNWRTYRRGTDFLNYYQANNRIFAAFQEDPTASAALWERFVTLREEGPLNAAWQRERLDAYYARIDRSAERDWEVWGDAYRTYDGWAEYREDHEDWTDFEGEKAYVYAWIEGREAYFRKLHP